MKETFYFSHDSNAMNDPKILALRFDYGMEGYGTFWAIIELFRTEENYKLPLSKTTFKSLKMLCNTSFDIEKFVLDCIEYNLFVKDDTHFWSESLINRMSKKDQVKQKKKDAINSRWSKAKEKNETENTNVSEINDNTDEIHMNYTCNTDVLQNEDKKDKPKKEPKKSKKKTLEESRSGKIQHGELVFLTEEQHNNLIEKFGIDDTKNRIENLNNYKASKGAEYISDYHTILSWATKDKDKQQPKQQFYAGKQGQNIQNGIHLTEKFEQEEGDQNVW